jgi:arginyl-tRNA synthetase
MDNSLISELAKALEPLVGMSAAEAQKLISKPQDRSHGDLTFPCFQLAKTLRISPPECAKKIAAELKLPAGISKVEIVGPYLNFRFDKGSVIGALVPQILRDKSSFGRKEPNHKKFIVEYSSPNIAKTFHVGHLRTTLIGHSLVQIYKHLGYDVLGINHLGDWGTQFGIVWAGCEIWGRPKDATVDSLVEVYRLAGTLKKAQEEGKLSAEEQKYPDVTQMARDYFIRLEAGDKAALEFWQWCLDVSMKYFVTMYDRLGIKFDHYTGESFYRDMLSDVENKVRSSGILEESRGALGVDCGKKYGFARVFAEDGRSLYITRDIATAMYREETFHPEKILYVVAAQQMLHFQQLIEIMNRMKHPVGPKMVHVSFGFVPGMKTREGGGISLKDFLDEMKDRALEAYKNEVEKRPEGTDENLIAEAVAIGATYFYFLSHSNVKDLHFTWEQALNFQGESGPYLQYAVARLNSIEVKANESGVDRSLFDASQLTEESAYDLASLLAQFPTIVENAGRDYEPYYISQYLIEVAKSFSRAYRELRVVGEDVSKELSSSRLALFMATREILVAGMNLLGIPKIERM